jgi:hypothetical protein
MYVSSFADLEHLAIVEGGYVTVVAAFCNQRQAKNM